MEFQAKLNSMGYYEAEPKPSVSDLEQHYSQKYYQHALGSYSNEYSPDEVRYFNNGARVAIQTANNLLVEKSLLDLGCGEGFFTKFFYSQEWNVSCCDFSDFGLRKHNPDMLPFFNSGDIYDAIKMHVSRMNLFGLVNLQNVLEHVLDPVSLLLDLKPLLGKNSAIRIKVPNDYSDFQNALMERGFTKNNWFSPPEHLSYFSNTGLTNILHQCGFKLLSLQADFPVELFLANKHSNYWADRKLGKEAHLTRVFCENYLIEKDINSYIDYTEAAAKLSFGRGLIAYACIN